RADGQQDKRRPLPVVHGPAYRLSAPADRIQPNRWLRIYGAVAHSRNQPRLHRHVVSWISCAGLYLLQVIEQRRPAPAVPDPPPPRPPDRPPAACPPARTPSTAPESGACRPTLWLRNWPRD